MNILAIDTSTKVASVAVKFNDKIISKNVSNEITHSEKLLPLVDEILKKSDTDIKSMNILACSNGPGSFTGIRIGLATIKGVGNVLKKPIFAINSTLLLAVEDFFLNKDIDTSKPIYICSLMDARNERAYYGIYLFKKDKNDKLLVTELLTVSNDYIDEILNKISSLNLNKDVPLIFCGNCISHFESVIVNYYSNTINTTEAEQQEVIISKANVFPDAKYIIKYLENSNDIKNNKNMYDYNTLDAVYARMSQAERMKKSESKR